MRLGRPAIITGAQREELWRRYKAGETILGIGRAISQRQATIHRVLQATGGIAPVPRIRSSRVLSLSEREEISRGICAGDSFRTIAKRLNRAVSTVSQEVARHGGQQRYRRTEADCTDGSRHAVRVVVATTNAHRPFVLSRVDREQFLETEKRDRSNRRGPFYAARDPRSHGDSQMLNRLLPIALLAIPLAGCSAVGQLTVKDYQAKSGQRVMAGQAEPTSEYQCQKLAQEKQDWGFKGNLDRAAAIERVTSVAVDAAPAKGANYVYVMAPSEKSIGGFNLNAFSDAQVAYYKCASLPAHSS